MWHTTINFNKFEPDQSNLKFDLNLERVFKSSWNAQTLQTSCISLFWIFTPSVKTFHPCSTLKGEHWSFLSPLLQVPWTYYRQTSQLRFTTIFHIYQPISKKKKKKKRSCHNLNSGLKYHLFCPLVKCGLLFYALSCVRQTCFCNIIRVI